MSDPFKNIKEDLQRRTEDSMKRRMAQDPWLYRLDSLINRLTTLNPYLLFLSGVILTYNVQSVGSWLVLSGTMLFLITRVYLSRIGSVVEIKRSSESNGSKLQNSRHVYTAIGWSIAGQLGLLTTAIGIGLLGVTMYS